MKIQTKIIAAIIALVIVGGIWAANTKESKPETLKIGMISILSGEYSVVGENLRNGALLATEEYNRAHPDSKIEFIPEDDGFDSKKALSAYQKLVGIDHIDALINVSTPSIGAIYDLVTKTDIPVIQGGEQPVQPTSDNVFQILPGNIELEKQLGAYIKEKGYKNPVVVFTNNDTMIRFKNAMVEGYGTAMKEYTINADEKDFRSSVLKASESNPDIVIVLMFPESGAQFVKQYANLKGKLPQLAFDANAQSGISDYQRILNGGKILDGALIAVVSSSVTQEFKDAYKKRFGTEPGFFSDLGYDAVNLLIATSDKDGEKWIENVKNANFTGVSGKIEFDNVGVRKPEVKIVTIKDGKIPFEN
ncbi:MAG: ABC transporter substrate-binding protein [Patescibacteria group bacterium]